MEDVCPYCNSDLRVVELISGESRTGRSKEKCSTRKIAVYDFFKDRTVGWNVLIVESNGD